MKNHLNSFCKHLDINYKDLLHLGTYIFCLFDLLRGNGKREPYIKYLKRVSNRHSTRTVSKIVFMNVKYFYINKNEK